MAQAPGTNRHSYCQSISFAVANIRHPSRENFSLMGLNLKDHFVGVVGFRYVVLLQPIKNKVEGIVVKLPELND